MKQNGSDSTANLTDAQIAQLRAAEDREPNTRDIPSAPESSWAHARQFYRPRKEAISIRLDADLLDWLRRKSDKYQMEINRILRQSVDADPSR